MIDRRPLTELIEPSIEPYTDDLVLDDQYDLVVVGGGITGVGCALDAALRGQSVLLLEARDIAAGTSSKSSKLVHGGIRYLEQFDFGLVRESLTEQRLLRDRLAPHLVTSLTFLMPSNSRLWSLYARLGTWLYDLLGKRGADKRSRLVGARDLRQLFPSISDNLTSGLLYEDAQMDDVRLAIAVAISAADAGARIITHAPVTGSRKTGDNFAISFANNRTVSARHVILAGGAWNGALFDLFGDCDLSITQAKGAHILVPKSRIEARQAIVTKTATSVLFIIPFEHAWVIGTTDTPHDGALDAIEASEQERDFILAEANKVLADPLTVSDVIGSFAGVRPLVSTRGGDTSTISRKHVVASTGMGATVIAGGKYTTYRKMAADAVDHALRESDTVLPTRTDREPLWGAAHDLGRIAADLFDQHKGLSPQAASSLARRYGAGAQQVLAYANGFEEYQEPVDPSLSQHIWAEIYFGVHVEGALDLEDLLHRRLRLDLALGDAGLALASIVDKRLVKIGLWHMDEDRLARFSRSVKIIRSMG